jgi:oxygen-independent coproporphyrinogen-3 oxidase
LEEEHFQKILDCLGKNLDITTTLELTVEAEPVTLTQRKADMLQKFGVNRISLGVQSLCDDVIKLSNRLDTEKKALKAIEIGRATGASVNIDLLSGMAGETPETWSYSVQRALSTEVESITVYKMELYANTEYYKGIRNQTLELPTDEQELEFMQYAIDQFQKSDYLPWSFFTFTKKGQYRHVHAPSVWQGDDCYAFGTSAFGHLNNWLYQNSNDLDKYMAAVQASELPISRGYELNSLDQMIRTVMLGMKLIRLDLKAFHKRFGFKLETLCAPVIEQLKTENFITLLEDVVELTPKGILHGDYSGKSLARCLMESYGN